MTPKMKLSALAAMPAAEKSRALAGIVESARAGRANGSSVLNSRIRTFELRYEMSSEKLRTKLRRGQIQETAEIAEWLFLLNARRSRVTK